jgi:anti-sigma factor RsiW
MSPSPSVEEVDLHALVDGEISGEDRRIVEDYLLRRPEEAARVENWRRQNAALHAAFEPVAMETPPLSLRNAAARNAAAGAPAIESGAIHWGRPSGSNRSVRRLDDARAGRRKRALLSSLAALAAGAVLAGAAVFLLTRPASVPAAAYSTAQQGYVDRADLTYRTYAQDPRPFDFDADQKESLLTALRLRVGFACAPDLSGLGLRLLGARVAPGLGAPAAVLFYEKGDSGARIALYFERTEARGAQHVAPSVDRGLTAIEWRGVGFAFVLVGPLGAEAMQQAAERAAGEVLAPAANEPR